MKTHVSRPRHLMSPGTRGPNQAQGHQCHSTSPTARAPTNWRTNDSKRPPNIRIKRRRQAKGPERRSTPRASGARATANQSMNLAASSLNRPPVSTPRLGPTPRTWWPLSRLALASTAPTIVAAVGHGWPVAIKADRNVMSMASNPIANTSMARSSVAGTVMFMSRSFTLQRTVAPASRHTLAKVLSDGMARAQPAWSCASCSMPPSLVQRSPALATRLGHREWEAQPLQNQHAEEAWLDLAFAPCRTPMEHVACAWS